MDITKKISEELEVKKEQVQAAVDLLDAVLPKEGALGGVEFHLRAPVVHGIDVAGYLIPSILLLPAARQQGQ